MALTQLKTTGLADDAVTLAKQAAGTDGQIITYDASGNPVAVGPGTDGQVLTSTGAGSPPAFEDVPAGGATINNATANELVTVASTTTQLDAESSLTFNGSQLLVGGGSSRDVYNGGGAVQIEGTSGATGSLSITNNRADSAGAQLHLAKSRGSSLGSNTIVQDADTLGNIFFGAADGTNLGSNAALISGKIDGTPGENDTPGRIEFHTTADGSHQPAERVRIDSAGKIGINTTSPQYQFEVDTTDTEKTSVGFSANGESADVRFRSNNVNEAGVIRVDESSGGGIMNFWNKTTGGTLTHNLGIQAGGDVDVKTGNLVIGTDQKGIKSTVGKIVVHATSGQITLKTDSNDVIMAQATDNSSYSNSILQSYGARNTTNGTWNLAHFYGPGFGGQFKVADSGNCTNTNNSYGSTSDERLKQDIVDAASQWNDIKGLRVRKFRWKAAPTAPLSIGLVAQEAETVSPGLVENTGVEEQDSNGHAQPKFDADGNRETVKTLKYSVLYMKAIKCLQEAQARIETLETKVAALEAG